MASIDDPTANWPRVLESPLIYNELQERIAFAIRSSIGIARIGTFVEVVIETLEHKAISESSEVMTKLTANLCIALSSSPNAVSFHQCAR
jgi:hypothetical protein